MAGKIKGITIVFDGEVTKLSKALGEIKSKTTAVNASLKEVNKELKFNPSNVELLAQKQTMLAQKIKLSENNLKDLKSAQQQLDSAGVSKTSDEYMRLQREIIKTESEIKYLNKEMIKTQAASSGIGQAGAKLTRISKSATKAGNALKGFSTAAAVVAGGIGLLAVKAGRAADDLNTLSKQYGINTTDLQNYQSTADLVDVSVETLAKTHSKLKKNMLAASQSGTGNAAKAFEALGVKVTKSNGHLRNGNVVYDECIAKLAGMKNETERDAYAMAIFGKSAAELNPMLEGGAETYLKFTKLMAKNKLDPVSPEALKKANVFNDALDTIKATFQRAALIIGTKLAGYLGPIMDTISIKLASLAGFIANLSPKTLSIVGAIASAIAVLAPFILLYGKITAAGGLFLKNLSLIATKIPMVGKALSLLGSVNPIFILIAAFAVLLAIIGKTGISSKDLAKKIESGVEKITTMLPVIIQAALSAIGAITTALPDLIPVIITGFITLLMALVQALPTILPMLVDGFVQLITAVANSLPELIPVLLQASIILFMALVKAIPEIAVAIWNALPQIVDAFKNGLQAVLPGVWASIKSTAASMFSSIVSTIGSIISRVVSVVTSPFRTAYSIISSIISKISSVIRGANFSFPHISLPHFSLHGKFSLKNMTVPHLGVNWYANGGIFNSPSVIGVGEAGKEAVVPLDRLQGMIDKAMASNNGQNARMDKIIEIMLLILQAQGSDTEIKIDKRSFARLVQEVV